MSNIPVVNNLDMKGNRVTNASDPTANTDLATKQYVDNVAAGLNWKQNVKGASTANLAVATALINGLVHDGVTYATGDRILLKNQTTASENGIYVIVAAGAASRATDADTSAEVANAAVRVAQGTTNADTMWQMVTDNITLGTTALTWTQFSGGATYTGSQTIQVSGGVISAIQKPSGGVTSDASGLMVDTTIVVRKFNATIGDGVAVDFTVTHNFNTKMVQVTVRDATTGQQIIVDNDTPTVNTVAVHFATAPASNAYVVIVQG